MVLDLRDPYSSYRWNPLDSIWDMYQEYISLGKGIKVHKDGIADYPDLEKVNDESAYGKQWYEWRGKAYADKNQLATEASVTRQKVYDEMYEDLRIPDTYPKYCLMDSNDKKSMGHEGLIPLRYSLCSSNIYYVRKKVLP